MIKYVPMNFRSMRTKRPLTFFKGGRRFLQTPGHFIFSVYHLKTNRINFKGNGYATTYYNPALCRGHGNFRPHSSSFIKSAPRCAATLRREKRRHTLGHLRQISVQPVAVEPPLGCKPRRNPQSAPDLSGSGVGFALRQRPPATGLRKRLRRQ